MGSSEGNLSIVAKLEHKICVPSKMLSGAWQIDVSDLIADKLASSAEAEAAIQKAKEAIEFEADLCGWFAAGGAKGLADPWWPYHWRAWRRER